MASKRASEKKMVVSTGAAQTAPVRKSAASRPTTRSAPVEVGATPAAEPQSATPLAVAYQLVEHQVEVPPQEAVAALAYSYWVARDCQGGSPEEDWLRAEQELRAACVACATA
jgi:hypothetical protein